MGMILPINMKSKKASDIFWRYAEPYITKLTSDGIERTPEEIEQALMLPWIVWNYNTIKSKNDLSLKTIIDAGIKHVRSEQPELIDYFMSRKRQEFGEYNHVLATYSLFLDEENELKLGIQFQV